MTDVGPLIRRMTEDLCALQNAMQANEPLSAGPSQGQFRHILNTELVTEFKGALDDLRSLLWRHMEEAATGPLQDGLDSRIEVGYRLLVAEMLRSLAQSATPLSVKPTPGTWSFFERIDFVVSARLAQEHRRKFTRDAA
jgi:hypothetical protein